MLDCEVNTENEETFSHSLSTLLEIAYTHRNSSSYKTKVVDMYSHIL